MFERKVTWDEFYDFEQIKMRRFNDHYNLIHDLMVKVEEQEHRIKKLEGMFYPPKGSIILR